MDSSFFTNEEENTLKNRINHNLKTKKNIEYLDFLIGYFRMTGFDKISDNLSSIKHTRILVGMNADKHTYNASQLIKKFSQEQVDIHNEEPLDEQEYQNFFSMKELITEKKIEVRISANRDVHSKMYIMRSAEYPDYRGNGITYNGSLIIGSSNLTHNGLEGNTEINAELNQDRDIVDAVKVFENLWEESVELTEEDFDKHILPKLKKPVEEEVSKAITPYELYIKLLIEHFGSRIDFINDENIFVPKEYKKLSYQVEAVNDGVAKLQKHNGFFLSDVVGLGKTVVIAMLIKKLETTLKKRVLIVIPPAVRIQWEDTLKEFAIGCCDIVSLAKLGGVKGNDYELVIVDESHKFKNSESKRYKELYDICVDKKVILLSATPQNNTPNDLYNQIALFQNVKNSTIAGCSNLQGFFSGCEKSYKNIMNAEDGIDKEALKQVSTEIRDAVLRSLMIRRTRYDIGSHKMYEKDIKAQNLSIPTVKTPKEHEYRLEGELGVVFTNTAKDISENLNYSRFNALSYIKKERRKNYYPHESDNIFDKNPLAGIMKTLLIKRFESSFSAFKISIERHEKRYKTFIENFNNDIIYLGEKATDILDYDEEQEEDYEVFIQRLIDAGKVKQLVRSDFNKAFEKDLKSDYNIFKNLVKTWKDRDADPKLEKFKEVLNNDRDKKIVIFTESVDTLKYIKSKIENKKILFITSQNREEMKSTIQENFDANYDLAKQRDDYTIIVTTDTLAEGINLHRSSIIYNYDIPWNATKLIQRIGRVNRIGTRAEFIDIHNFKPASQIEDVIELSQKAFVKLQSSHTMMGEDNQIYSKEELVSSVNLFDAYKKEANEKDEELDYLEELRNYRENNPIEFKKIVELEQGFSLTRKAKEENAYVVLNINNNRNYVYVDETTIKSLTFVEMAEALKSSPDEVALKNDKERNEQYHALAVAYFEDAFKKNKQDKSEGRIEDELSQKAIGYLKEWLRNKLLDRKLFKEYREAIQKGILGLISVKKVIALKKVSDEEKKEVLQQIIKNQKREATLFDEELLVKIVLSEVKKKG